MHATYTYVVNTYTHAYIYMYMVYTDICGAGIPLSIGHEGLGRFGSPMC